MIVIDILHENKYATRAAAFSRLQGVWMYGVGERGIKLASRTPRILRGPFFASPRHTSPSITPLAT